LEVYGKRDAAEVEGADVERVTKEYLQLVAELADESSQSMLDGLSHVAAVYLARR
jgi:hypothetical protein